MTQKILCTMVHVHLHHSIMWLRLTCKVLSQLILILFCCYRVGPDVAIGNGLGVYQGVRACLAHIVGHWRQWRFFGRYVSLAPDANHDTFISSKWRNQHPNWYGNMYIHWLLSCMLPLRLINIFKHRYLGNLYVRCLCEKIFVLYNNLILFNYVLHDVENIWCV